MGAPHGDHIQAALPAREKELERLCDAVLGERAETSDVVLLCETRGGLHTARTTAATVTTGLSECGCRDCTRVVAMLAKEAPRDRVRLVVLLRCGCTDVLLARSRTDGAPINAAGGRA